MLLESPLSSLAKFLLFFKPLFPVIVGSNGFFGFCQFVLFFTDLTCYTLLADHSYSGTEEVFENIFIDLQMWYDFHSFLG